MAGDFTAFMADNLVSIDKFERIKLIRRLGLNTEESVLVKTEAELEKAAPMLEKASIRTFVLDNQMLSKFGEVKPSQIPEFDKLCLSNSDDFNRLKSKAKVPHIPVTAEILRDGRQLLSQGYTLIIAKCIDPADAELAGAARIADHMAVIELANGPCTTRRVTHEGKIDLRAEVDLSYIYHDDCRVRMLARQLAKIPFDRVVVELSYYRVPVGWKQENAIIWDITADGSQALVR